MDQALARVGPAGVQYKLAAEQLQADYHQKQRANATVQATLDAARTEVLDKLIRDELHPDSMGPLDIVLKDGKLWLLHNRRLCSLAMFQAT